MLNVQRALQNDRLLRALTGLNRKAFEELKSTFAEVLTTTEVPRRSPLPRQRAAGAGRKPILATLATVEAQLFFIPHKKPKGGQLTDEQKAENQALARERVVGEPAFAGLKRYGIASQVYRNRKPGFDDRSMLTASGLWNFYLMAA